MVKDNKERMLKCKNCGQMEYPKISPAVMCRSDGPKQASHVKIRRQRI